MSSALGGDLRGRTILDCSAGWPGPFMGRLLMEKGARVVKVENPNRDDVARSVGGHYDWLNENKEIMKLDLTSPEGKADFASLVERADGLIEGFRPKARVKIGLDEETLHSINPRLCIVSMVGYPEDGPLKDRPGHEINYQALSGISSIFNGMAGLAVSDFFTAYEGAVAMLGALDFLSRTKGAPGKRMVISIFETSQKIQWPLINDYKETGVVPVHGETIFTGALPCHRLYEAKDGRKISVGPIENIFWNKLCELLDTPEIKDQGHAKGDEAKEVIRTMQDAFSQKTWAEWEPIFAENDCCVEVVKDYSELF
jgi:crotonobetainyl-CoA:carnitine CoA-transferase CaiB-like acyl-CoA transferase